MSAANFFQTVRGARANRPLGFFGQVLEAAIGAMRSGLNADGQAKQVTTVAIPASPDNSTEYSVTSNSVTASFTTDASATQAELGAGLLAAINAAGGLGQILTAAYAGGTLTLTGKWPGVSFTVAASGGSGGGAIGTPSTSTSAASADAVSFGRVLMSDGYVTGEASPKVKVPTTSELTAQVMTFTVAGTTGDSWTPTVKINGKVYTGDAVAWTTDADTTAAAIAAEINAIMPTETVVAAGVGSSSGSLTLTAEVEGAEFDADVLVAVAGDSTKAYTNGPSVATSLRRSMVGLSARRLDVENQTEDGDDPAYEGNEGVEYLGTPGGTIVVQRDTSETWSYGDELYVSVASATKGRVYNTAGTDRIWMGDKLVAERQEASGLSDGLGVIRLLA